MQVKISSEGEGSSAPKRQQQPHDKSCTSSIYISQPSTRSVSNDHVKNGDGGCESGNNKPQNPNVDSVSNVEGNSCEQKPVLTIQVNQNNSMVMNPSTTTTMNSNSSNLVNIVSCFRAYPSITPHAGIENVVQSNNNSNNNAPFSVVSVNRNNNHCNYGGNVRNSGGAGDESVNNENNQNMVNMNPPPQKHHRQKASNALATITRDDLNEISVDQILISEQHHRGDFSQSTSNVDYQNMTLDSITNRDHVGLIGAETEKIVITTTAASPSAVISESGVSANPQLGSQSTAESVINQITIAGEVESAVNRVTNETCVKTESQQTFREQRRRERRERRQARQRAQHGHHHVTAPVHHRSTAGVIRNGVEPSRTNYEILPDIINNHLPPPYTTLPLQMQPPLSPPTIHAPIPINPVPVVVDDCRFSFPIPIIRR